jgi:hypothetical protein
VPALAAALNDEEPLVRGHAAWALEADRDWGRRRRRGAGWRCRRTTGGVGVAPRTAVEKVLGMERVGLNENFFDLGGHSFLAVRPMAQGGAGRAPAGLGPPEVAIVKYILPYPSACSHPRGEDQREAAAGWKPIRLTGP